MTEEKNETRRKRLTFQSNHRGCKEMDMVMGQFCERHAATMSDDEMTLYEALLEEDDLDIWNWVVERTAPVDQKYLPMIEKMRNYTPAVKQQAEQ